MRFRSRTAEVLASVTFYGLAAYICLVALIHVAVGLHVVHLDHFSGLLHWRWSLLAFAAMTLAYLGWFRTLQYDLSRGARTRECATQSPRSV